MKVEKLENILNVYINELIQEEKADSTIRTYKRCINSFIDYLKSMHIDDFSKLDLIEYKKIMSSEKSMRYVNLNIIAINRFIKFADLYSNDKDFDRKKLKHYQCSYFIKTFKIQNQCSLENVISPVEYKRISKKALYTDKYKDLHYIIECFVHTGIRIGELKYFTVESVKSGELKIYNKGKYREVPIPGDLKRKILKYCEKKEIHSGLWFKRYLTDNNAVNDRKIRKDLKKVASMCKGVRLDHVYPHSFRHLFAISYIKTFGNANLSELAGILGHSDINTTAIYTQTSKSSKKRAMENVII